MCSKPLVVLFCLFIGIYACQVDEDGVVNKGTLAFRMNVDTALVGVSTKASDLADFKDVNSYAVTIAQDSGVVAEYSRFDKMPAELELGAGAYTIQVSKGTETAAAFDAPYFPGKGIYDCQGYDYTGGGNCRNGEQPGDDRLFG